jgi:hypothetical protein
MDGWMDEMKRTYGHLFFFFSFFYPPFFEVCATSISADNSVRYFPLVHLAR